MNGLSPTDRADLDLRLHRALDELEGRRRDAVANHEGDEVDRLSGKIEGVKLAISYLDEYR